MKRLLGFGKVTLQVIKSLVCDASGFISIKIKLHSYKMARVPYRPANESPSKLIHMVSFLISPGNSLRERGRCTAELRGSLTAI